MASIKSILTSGLLALPLVLPVALSTSACSDDVDNTEPGPDDDQDGDGVTPNEGDCNDLDRSIYPGAPDPCDGKDQNCNGIIDEDFDVDQDNFTSCGGDCRDNDPTSYPGAVEIVDGLDNDCDGIADNHTDQSDDDGDGFSEDQGDCNDNPDNGGALIGPNAIEVALNADGEPELIDNDCDGIVDEAIAPCPVNLDTSDPLAYASSLELCEQVIQATRSDVMDVRSQNILPAYGDTYVPLSGENFVVLSTGIAIDANDPNFVDQDLSFAVSSPRPEPLAGQSADVQDISSLTLDIQVPSNAKSFSFDFNFMSIEFPEFVGLGFDDTFLAILESEAFTGNVSFDSMGNRVSINVGFFNVCDPSLNLVCTGGDDLLGTGFGPGAVNEGGGTGWLTTTAPVVPGEKIKLTFLIFDDGDNILNSAVLIDSFRWGLEDVEGPVTVD